MTGLAERLLEQLRRLGSMSVVAVPLTFAVTEDDASAAIAELIEGKQAYRAGARVFASTASSGSGPVPVPAAPPRQVKAPPTPPPRQVTPPPTAPRSRPVMNPPAQAEARNRAMRDLTIADSAAARKDYRGTVTEPEARPVSATARAASIAAAAVPRESNQEAAMAETKVCSKCEKRKSVDDFYSGQGKCKRCFLDDQKASKLARAAGAGGGPGNEGGGPQDPKVQRRRSTPAQRPTVHRLSRIWPSSPSLRAFASGRCTRRRPAWSTCPITSTSPSGSCSSWRTWLRE
ncbi:MAG: hypothetical protein KGL39_15445 [Patescibacteria group bacterium]|nr:hypothetical protein [Patescibacteria group bacterium]